MKRSRFVGLLVAKLPLWEKRATIPVIAIVFVCEAESMSELDIKFADRVPWSDDFTDYDWQHRVAYVRLLDAKADGAEWDEAARIILHLDTVADRERSYLCWESHMQRAEWMTHTGYKRLIASGHRFDRRFFH